MRRGVGLLGTRTCARTRWYSSIQSLTDLCPMIVVVVIVSQFKSNPTKAGRAVPLASALDIVAQEQRCFQALGAHHGQFDVQRRLPIVSLPSTTHVPPASADLVGPHQRRGVTGRTWK